ncbi:DUF4136 domain-containing protein [Desulfosediminicola flagellatus]|uniref:DUF4136 domain-containing protein n=1 Tax=Desulfosediminicola flagellatus TaxID=2569541 RepID=UPI0010ACB4AA|nr:DUF4136 domain-containing protein [Desulfosediminicola flagellatus]
MRNIVLFIVVVVMMSGCSTVEVKHNVASPSKLYGFQYFAWVESGEASGDVRAKNPKIDKYVRTAVEKELIMKGYSKVEPEHANFLVSWFGRVEEKVKEQTISHFYRSYGYGALAGKMKDTVAEGAIKTSYDEGTLVLDILDNKDKEVVWRGVGTDTIVDGMNDSQIAAYINKSVRMIVADFPDRQ